MTSNNRPTTFTFQHAQLGRLTGIITPDSVVQFKAIPYATIPARFKQSILNDAPVDGDGDFTKVGHACPQTFPDHVAGGGALPNEIIPHPSDEFKCLILLVNVPLACLQSPAHLSKLPVLVYIHGGGFVLGKIDEQHNTSLMVEQSLIDAQPIVSVSIQYRLGALGYLQTPEPGNLNLALNDQRNALLWIQKFIDGFGGDHQRVTAFGESGGSMSICAQILAPPPETGPLFKRAILMSGILGPATAPASVEEGRGVYRKFLKDLGIHEEGEVVLQKLRETDIDTIVKTSARMGDGGALWLSVRDEQFFGKDAADMTWERIPEYISKADWLEEVVLGTTSFEATTFMDRMAGITPKEFLDGVLDHSGPESAQRVSDIYEVTPNMDQNLFITRMLRWAGDIIFDVPNHVLARYLTQHTNKKIYRYIFDVRNPFPNSPFYQQPHHWVDKYFVFKAHQFRYPTQRLKDISTRHAQLWIDVANGKAPWAEYRYTGDGNEIIMVADDRDGWVQRSVAEDEKITELSWKRCEEYFETWDRERGRSFNPLLIEPMRGKKLT